MFALFCFYHIFFHWFCFVFPKVLLFLLQNLSAAWFTFSRHTLDLWDSTSNYERRRPIQNWSKQNGKVTWAFNGQKCRHQELEWCRRHCEMARGIQGNGKLGISKNYFFSFTWTNVSSRCLEKESKGKKKNTCNAVTPFFWFCCYYIDVSVVSVVVDVQSSDFF